MTPRLRLRVAGFALVALPLAVVVLRSLLRALGASNAVALGAAVVLTAVWALGGALLLRLRFSGWFPRRAEQGRIAAVWAGLPSTTLGLLAVLFVGLPWFAGVAVALVGAVVAFPVYRRQLDASLLDQVERLCQVRSMDESDALVATCRAWLADPRRKPERRLMVELNLAYGLVVRASLADRPDGLDEVFPLVRRLLVAPDLDLWRLRYIAQTLLDAEVTRTERNGDLRGYEAAVALVDDLARREPRDAAMSAKAAQSRAELLLYRVTRPEVSEDERVRQLGHVERLMREALDVCPPALELEVDLLSHVALATMRPGGDPDEGVRVARDAVGKVRRGWPETAAHAEITLARLLVHRVAEERAGAEALGDLDEAERRARDVERRDVRAGVFTHALLAEIAVRRARLAESTVPDARRDVLDRLRTAFHELRRFSFLDASRAAEEWAAAAVELDDVGAAAEAHLQWVRQLVTEVERRTDPDERDRVVADLQGLGAEAGMWLARAERPTDAVVALEAARAVLLSRRARRLPPQLAERLAEAGRGDLFADYGTVVDAIQALDRSLHRGDPRSPDAPLVVAGTAYATGAVTYELELWSRHDRLRHEIDAVLEVGDVEAADFAFVQAEAEWAPVVYLVAASETGYAVVVGASGPPEVVWLPELTRAEVESRATPFVQGEVPFGQVMEQLGPLLDWLWTAVMGDVVEALPAGEVVVVAVGALGLLPLHAATDAGGSPVCDRLAVRYAPNARMAATARRAARDQDALSGPALVVAVPKVAGLPEIPGVIDEARAVARIHATAALLDADLDDVVTSLPAASVWHLACHGVAVADDPLRSALFLRDGELRLRDILAMPPGRHRLAVLSACRSAAPDPARLDEVVGFPAGLLQAGVAAVLCTQWIVDDDVAAALTVRFHALLRAGATPAVALAQSQNWVRAATNADLIAELGPDYRVPAGLPPAALNDPAWQAQRRFTHPAFWAAFAVTGA